MKSTHSTEKATNEGSGSRGAARRRGNGYMAQRSKREWANRSEQLEAALVALIDAVDSGDRDKIATALTVGRGLTF